MFYSLIVMSIVLGSSFSDPILVPAYQAAMSFMPQETRNHVIQDINSGVDTLLSLVRMQGLENCVEKSVCSLMCSPYRFSNQGGEIVQIIRDFEQNNLHVSSENYQVMDRLINAADQGIQLQKQQANCYQCAAGNTCPMSANDMLRMVSSMGSLLNFK